MGTQRTVKLGYKAPPELSGGAGPRRPVVIVGGGPVGLTAALDCALHGVPVVLLDEDDTVSMGSRAICWSKRALEILDRLGVAERIAQKGVTWNVGKVFHRDRLVYAFDLLPETGHKMPAFVNLQQYFVEEYLIERAREMPGIELRWKNRVVGVAPHDDGVTLTVDTPDGAYALEADYVLAADGARSLVRKLMGLSFDGWVFEDRFLIADVKMKADFPTERWFWFDPPFHPGQSALLHKQADDVWRIDLQLGWRADPEEEKRPEKVIPRLKAMLGEDVPFELEWVSIYTFQCRRLAKFRHGRVFFVGDSAHQVSPFGARGGNSGIQDADNLVWKLALVLADKAPDALLDSYDEERVAAADENIMHSTRSTDFITPKGVGAQVLRDAALSLAGEHAFARRLVNSGRLSTPTTYAESGLGTPDRDLWEVGSVGMPCADAPILRSGNSPGWLLNALGNDFQVMIYVDRVASGGVPLERIASAVARLPVGCRLLAVTADGETAKSLPAGVEPTIDTGGLVRRRYDLTPGAVYLIRPDQHVAGRWREWDEAAVRGALDRALGRVAGTAEVKGAVA